MSGPTHPPLRLAPAVVTWVVAWVAGMILAGPLVAVAVDADFDSLATQDLAAVAASGWAVAIVVLVFASRRWGTGDFWADYAVRFRPSDVLGIPAGALAQFVAVPLLYWPLQQLWPDTFASDEIERRAQEMVDRADGWLVVLLALVVVVGAPVVEELMYRGLLQRSLMSRLGPALGLFAGSVWFALVHPQPVEYPGLLLAGLVFGGFVVATDRIGGAILAHAAFNAAGLAMALS